MEGFFSTHHEHHHSYYEDPEPLTTPLGFSASCRNLETAAAAAMAYESSSSSPLASMVYSPPLLLLQQQGSFPPFDEDEALLAAAVGGDDKRRMVSIERSGTTSLGSAQEMDGSRKHQRNNANVASVKEKRPREHGGADVDVKEAPAGYIHVRAKRGQARDSHSLAERVRREKISEKMLLLQSLVPGCDKVTGKAMMLDEIISYVQSLQNQVEFLSMKLASLNPMMMYEFGVDIGMYPDAPQVMATGAVPVLLPHTSLVETTGLAAQNGSSVSEMQQLQGLLQQEEFSCFFDQ